MTLSDDAGEPIRGAWVEVHGRNFELRGARPCGASPATSVVAMGAVVRVKSSELGRGCVALRGVPAAGTLDLRFAGDSHHGATDGVVPFDENGGARTNVAVRFDAPTYTIKPGARTVRLRLEARAMEKTSAPLSGVNLEVSDEAGSRLATASTDEDGTASLELPPSQLAAPGRRNITARFAGDEEHASASAHTSILTQAQVHLSTTSAPSRVSAGDEFEFTVSADADGSPIDVGIIELTRAGRVVASAPLKAGRAAFTLAVESDVRGTQSLEARYVGGPEHLVSDSPLAWELNVAGPGLGGRVALTGLVLAGAALVLSSWRRSRARAPERRDSAPATAGIHVEAPTEDARRFFGTVLDAHSRQPIQGATVRLKRPTLDGHGIEAEVTTERDGRFDLNLATSAVDGVRLEVSARDHASENQVLSRGGRLTIALVTRRRALLQRFAHWVRRASLETPHLGEATPAEVRAQLRARPDVAEWTSAVERAAFGPERLDAMTDERLRSEEPR